MNEEISRANLTTLGMVSDINFHVSGGQSVYVAAIAGETPNVKEVTLYLIFTSAAGEATIAIADSNGIHCEDNLNLSHQEAVRMISQQFETAGANYEQRKTVAPVTADRFFEQIGL